MISLALVLGISMCSYGASRLKLELSISAGLSDHLYWTSSLSVGSRLISYGSRLTSTGLRTSPSRSIIPENQNSHIEKKVTTSHNQAWNTTPTMRATTAHVQQRFKPTRNTTLYAHRTSRYPASPGFEFSEQAPGCASRTTHSTGHESAQSQVLGT
ncbi:hypothetical protein BJ138DRAFT_921042 [Hygrophoropsis aurantiaca]|uniref:Uncharacterized protein n=1 Tax=Hygrophoropsis aurantiaca TaxID=72124 RepID=A0ACB8ADT3_9AGAM|nr:hypothetical protein BJ138DRAFT_921042 [Hygrophoropsis aurantiaca]